jgi:hypothetical protein
MAEKGKWNDLLQTRLDMKKINVRPEHHPILQPDGTKKLPVAPHGPWVQRRKRSS